DTAREIIGQPELAAMLFGLGAIGLARQPDGVLADIGHALRERRQTKAASSTTAAPGDDPTGDDQPAERPEAAPPPAAATAVLELRGIRAGYGEVEVLHGVDLVVPAGHVVAVLGANGAGKSTLCSVAAGLLTPAAGSVWLSGRDVTAEPPHRRARAGLVLAPEARGVFPGLTVDDNLAIRLRTPELRRAAHDRFPILGQRRGQLAGLLSGGEQQQLALAGALADPPVLFIADEP